VTRVTHPFACSRCGAGFTGASELPCPLCGGAIVGHEPELHVVDGRLELGERLGAGRATEVFEARWTTRDGVVRDVAVKRIRADQRANARVYERFEREAARLAMAIPGVVPLLTLAETADGARALVLPRYDRSLRGGRGVHTVPAIGAALALALRALHQRDLLHRDLHPANVLLDPRAPHVGPPIALADLGHSWRRGEPPLTPEGHAVGTRGYLAPEVLAGDPATAASDVYSLGVVLFEQLAGERPFACPDPDEELRRITSEIAFPLASYERAHDAPTELTSLVDAMIAREPESRPRIEDLVSALG
jgi:serine/threonine protein kinase